MSEATPQKSVASKLSIIFAGEMHSGGDYPLIKMLDGSLVAVFVRAMPVRHLATVLNLALKEAELLDYVCLVINADGLREPVEPGWADNLADESHVQLYEAAKRQNFSRATSWAERQIVAKQASGELELKIEQVMQPMLQRMAGLLTSSPKPPALPVEHIQKS